MSVPDLYGVQLPPGFEIRQLQPHHESWANAVESHANIYASEIFFPLSKGRHVATCLELYRGLKGIYDSAIATGLCYGVFDTNYVFRRPESEAAGGALYWDDEELWKRKDDPDMEKDGKRVLRERMDFPLVSVAMVYDQGDPSPAEALNAALNKCLNGWPQFGAVKDPKAARSQENGMEAGGDKEEEEDAGKPVPKLGEGIGDVGTATVSDYSGKGLMKALAHFQMHEAKARGYSHIDIGFMSHAVCQVWTNPPPPYKAEVKMCFTLKDVDQEKEKEALEFFKDCKQWLKGLVRVHLKEEGY